MSQPSHRVGPLRIGMFTDTYSPSINGVVTSLHSLERGLRELGHEVFVIAPAHPNAEKEQHVVRLRSVPYPSQPEQRMALPPSLRKMLEVRRLNLDVVHTHGISVPVFGLVMSRALRVPLVTTYHTRMRDYIHYYPGHATLEWLTDAERWYLGGARSEVGAKISDRLHDSLDGTTTKFAENFDVWFANRCNEIITPAQPMAQELRQMGVEAPIHVIPNGVHLDRLMQPQPDPYPALGIPDGAARLVTVSRLGKEKSLDELLVRFALVLQVRPDAHLILVGDGPERAALEQQAKDLGIAQRVVFCGYVKSSDVGAYYQHAHLFVFASISETQGLVALEAGACGLPVVARNEMGVTTCVLDGETGFLVDVHDTPAFANACLDLLGNEEKRLAFGAAGVVFAQREGSYRTMAERTVRVYHNVIGDHHAAQHELEDDASSNETHAGVLSSLGRAATRLLSKRGLL